MLELSRPSPMGSNAVNHFSVKTVWDKPHFYPDPFVILHDEKQPQRRGERRGKGIIVFSATSAPLRCRLSPVWHATPLRAEARQVIKCESIVDANAAVFVAEKTCTEAPRIANLEFIDNPVRRRSEAIRKCIRRGCPYGSDRWIRNSHSTWLGKKLADLRTPFVVGRVTSKLLKQLPFSPLVPPDPIFV